MPAAVDVHAEVMKGVSADLSLVLQPWWLLLPRKTTTNCGIVSTNSVAGDSGCMRV